MKKDKLVRSTYSNVKSNGHYNEVWAYRLYEKLFIFLLTSILKYVLFQY